MRFAKIFVLAGIFIGLTLLSVVMDSTNMPPVMDETGANSALALDPELRGNCPSPSASPTATATSTATATPTPAPTPLPEEQQGEGATVGHETEDGEVQHVVRSPGEQNVHVGTNVIGEKGFHDVSKVASASPLASPQPEGANLIHFSRTKGCVLQQVEPSNQGGTASPAATAK